MISNAILVKNCQKTDLKFGTRFFTHPGYGIVGHITYTKMAKSVHAIVDKGAMEWLPLPLMSDIKSNAGMWAQHVKQVIMLTAGIETKMQEDMNKGQREDFMSQEYNNWIGRIVENFPCAAVKMYLKYTTATLKTKVDGHYLYRNFCEGLRLFHASFIPVWNRVLQGQISGKSGEELWIQWCYLLQCEKANDKPEDWYPEGFAYDKVEKKKFVMAFKYMGPPCERLQVGMAECHEFLANPTGVGVRGTGTPVRKSKNLGRKAHREKKAKNTRRAVLQASSSKHALNALALGRTQTVTNLMKLQCKESNTRFEQLFKLHSICTDAAMKTAIVAQMSQLTQSSGPTFKDCERTLYGPVVDLTQEEECAGPEEEEEDEEEPFDDKDVGSADEDAKPEDAKPEDAEAEDAKTTAALKKAADEKADNDQSKATSSVMEAVYEASGYIILPKVMIMIMF